MWQEGWQNGNAPVSKTGVRKDLGVRLLYPPHSKTAKISVSMDSPAEEIRKRIDIIDFISGFIELKKAGRNYKAICPFHQEKTPSFVVSPDRQIWHCFGSCGDGGDVIKFLMKWENITFYEALKELAQKTGVKLDNIDFEDQAWKKRERLFAINNLACDFYHYILLSHAIGKKCLDYLAKRALNEKLIKTFRLGYSPSSWDSLLKFLKKKGYSYEDCYEAGLAVKSERGSFYDRFRSRLVFPLKDPRGNILGFSGRILESVGQAKYVNTPETSIYHKRETLFGIYEAKDAIKKNDSALIVEGEFDMISCFANGIANTVAVKGSAVSREQLNLIKRYTKKIILALDADFSGDETAKKAFLDGENLDMEISVAAFSGGKDPDESLKKNPGEFKKSVANPIPIYDFIIKLAKNKYPDEDAMSKKHIGDEVMPFLINIQNPIVKSYYIKKLASVLSVDQQAVENLLQKEFKKRRNKIIHLQNIKPTKSKDRLDLIQKYILSLVLQNLGKKSIAEQVFSIIKNDDFYMPSYKKMLEYYLEYQIKLNESGSDYRTLLDTFSSTLPAELTPVMDEILLFDIEIFGPDLVEKELNKTLYEFKRLSIKRKIKEKLMEDEKSNSSEIKELMANLTEIEKKIIIL